MTGLPFLNIDESHPDHVSVTITDIVGFIEYLQSSMLEPRYTDEWRAKIDRITVLIKECQMLGLTGMSVPDGVPGPMQSDFEIPEFEIDHGYQPDFEDEELRELAGADHPLYGLADYVEKFLSAAKRQAAADFPEMERLRRAHIEASQDINQLVEARRRLGSEIAYGELHPAFRRAAEDITSKINYLKDQALAPSGKVASAVETTSQMDTEVLKSFFTEEGVKLIPFIIEEYTGATASKIAPLLTVLEDYIAIKLVGQSGADRKRGKLFKALKTTVALKGGDSGFTKAINNYARVRDLVDDISARLKRRAKPLDIPLDDRKYVKDLDDARGKKGEWIIKISEASR